VVGETASETRRNGEVERDGSADSDRGWQRGEAAPPFPVHVRRPQLPLFMVFPPTTQYDGGAGFAPALSGPIAPRERPARPEAPIPRTRPAQGKGRKGRRSLVTEYMGCVVTSGLTHAATHPSAVDPSPRLMMPDRQARKYYVKITVS
jgi:hypothetical protein